MMTSFFVRLAALLVAGILFSGCAQYLKEELKEGYVLQSQVAVAVGYEVQFSDENGNKKKSEQLYKAEDDLNLACATVKRVGHSKVWRGAVELFPLLGALATLEWCKETAREIDERFFHKIHRKEELSEYQN